MVHRAPRTAAAAVEGVEGQVVETGWVRRGSGGGWGDAWWERERLRALKAARWELLGKGVWERHEDACAAVCVCVCF